ncbi:MAG: bifunctional 2-keto-4-hydroxyglutarate aldolase/2-keto-3-deoxy-6-phosphogluconate aldolase [Clostridiales bacterium]|nr:bifunctional 2-keto-4-hydroxyglutarate aldolase/2-keto-3-deoxy-6-phosphogluconate aldolase [Clostridiales bacterium]
MKRDLVYDLVKKTGIIAVIHAEDPDECLKLVDAVVQGGIRIIEITMTVPGAIDIIKHITSVYGENSPLLLGAGTVLDSETARLCIHAGAQFIISPMLSIEIIKLCNRYAAAVIPGVMTVTEAVTAMEYGCTMLKLFPSDIYGPSILKTFKGPLPMLDFIPTGGIKLKNAGKWISSGAAAIGAGSDLTGYGLSYSSVTSRAKKYVRSVIDAKASLLSKET